MRSGAETHRRDIAVAVRAGQRNGGNRYAALPDTGRTPDEILGYDEPGLPK
jgi:antitoxin VapB